MRRLVVAESLCGLCILQKGEHFVTAFSILTSSHIFDIDTDTFRILITFSRRISVRDGVSEIVSHGFLRPAAVHRTWISSSISILTKTCLLHLQIT
jgi:hypothetical protein